ncbi:hypothetical protein [Helicobacter sp. 11S02629-2]|uniref:hypothetical protein n=1 Tax=Helicobacter sp. 11S02629-2 TaxID=1476195 RepID=UPI000BA55FCA|nr:hypothetical protein [Helicobacter sp. 11S02629-2]PAF42756.1 hypothetical protein BKH40_07630 [Helicobacter sp. 11S02629-2]
MKLLEVVLGVLTLVLLGLTLLFAFLYMSKRNDLKNLKSDYALLSFNLDNQNKALKALELKTNDYKLRQKDLEVALKASKEKILKDYKEKRSEIKKQASTRAILEASIKKETIDKNTCVVNSLQSLELETIKDLVEGFYK